MTEQTVQPRGGGDGDGLGGMDAAELVAEATRLRALVVEHAGQTDFTGMAQPDVVHELRRLQRYLADPADDDDDGYPYGDLRRLRAGAEGALAVLFHAVDVRPGRVDQMVESWRRVQADAAGSDQQGSDF